MGFAKGFVRLALLSKVTKHLDQLGIKAPFVPTVQVDESAAGGISTKRSLDYARSQKAKGELPVFNITPKDLTPTAIATIRQECINFNGRVGTWTGTGAYPSDPAQMIQAIEAVTPKVMALYKAIDGCDQPLGRTSAPSPGL